MKGLRIAKDIIFLVCGIMSIVSSVTLITLSGVFIGFSTPGARDVMIEQLNNGTLTTSFPGTPEEQVMAIQALLLSLAISFILITLFSVANAIISFMCRKKGNKTLYILAIVFGALSGQELNIVGGVFGLITHRNEQTIIY